LIAALGSFDTPHPDPLRLTPSPSPSEERGVNKPSPSSAPLDLSHLSNPLLEGEGVKKIILIA
jgi:hypothetical protein